MPVWINFQELRSKLRFENVLRHYQIDAKRRGGRVVAFCPLPSHPKRADGSPRTASLSINLERNIFQCFSCKAGGNALDFACRMEGFDPSNPQQFRQGAVKVKDLFQIATSAAPPQRLRGKSEENRRIATPPPSSQKTTAVINAPLDFELKNLDMEHPYLKARDFTDETIRHFGLGYCNRGMLKDRIAIPLHNPKGRLVGYAGRITDDSLIGGACLKYLFPENRDKEGVPHEFRKSHLLYNAHRIKTPVDHLFVVQGFTETWWLWQARYYNTVGLMDSRCSDEQGELIVNLVKPDGKVWLMPAGTDAGVDCAHSIFERVAPHRFVRWLRLPANERPTDFQKHELLALLQ